jgi:hypothetical protein
MQPGRPAQLENSAARNSLPGMAARVLAFAGGWIGQLNNR